MNEADKTSEKAGKYEKLLNDFANDTDADLAAYVQMYRTRIADMTDEIDAKERGEQSMRSCVMLSRH